MVYGTPEKLEAVPVTVTEKLTLFALSDASAEALASLFSWALSTLYVYIFRAPLGPYFPCLSLLIPRVFSFPNFPFLLRILSDVVYVLRLLSLSPDFFLLFTGSPPLLLRTPIIACSPFLHLTLLLFASLSLSRYSLSISW